MAANPEKEWASEEEQLFEAFLLLQNVEEVKDFLSDLLTRDELRKYAARWHVIRLLLGGGLTHREIREKTGVSRTTISRANQVIKYGTGMSRLLWERMRKKQIQT